MIYHKLHNQWTIHKPIDPILVSSQIQQLSSFALSGAPALKLICIENYNAQQNNLSYKDNKNLHTAQHRFKLNKTRRNNYLPLLSILSASTWTHHSELIRPRRFIHIRVQDKSHLQIVNNSRPNSLGTTLSAQAVPVVRLLKLTHTNNSTNR